jgi:diguanylate cyclase (GGDEF)-like protein
MEKPVSDRMLGRVLVVDDQLENLRTLTGILGNHHYHVRSAISGKMALAVVQFWIPDVILLDLNMPRMDGYAVCRRIKMNPNITDVPIIFMSGINDVLNMVKAFAVGGVDYVLKPFRPIEVLARVRTHTMLRQLQLQLQVKNRLLEARNQQLMQEVQSRMAAEARLQILNQSLMDLAHQDELTQIPNRRRFDDYLVNAWQWHEEQSQDLSVIFCDVDYFKCYNDCYGHQQGDRCLISIAQAIARVVPSQAVAARYGGEEFAIILPRTDRPAAVKVAQQIQQAIAQLEIVHARSVDGGHVTLSMGISSTRPQSGASPYGVLRAADRALYAAKGQGRNCWCFQDYVVSNPLSPSNPSMLSSS